MVAWRFDFCGGGRTDRTDDAMSGGQSIEQVIFHTAAIDLGIPTT